MSYTEKAQAANLNRWRLIITVVIAILTFSWLLWSYFHGGIPSHHILDQKDLPAISNWWSGIFLPIFAWVLLGKTKTRIEKETNNASHYKAAMKSALGRFSTGLFLGAILSVSFVNNYEPFLDNILYLLLILSVITPIFFSEFILGFVLGMTYTFGAILPAIFMLIMGAIGFITYRFIRPLIMKFIK